MLQAARRAPHLLGESTALVAAFLRSQLNSDGGFSDRGGQSDLYYTVFGIEGLLALEADIPVARVADYLKSFGAGEDLDFVHTTCLARCWAALPGQTCPVQTREKLIQRVASFRSDDGAYNANPGSEEGTLYGCFLAVGACQDLDHEIPGRREVLDCIAHLRADDGGYANGDDLPMGLTPPTAAAASLLLHLGEPVPTGLSDWLLERHRPEGGFFATPLAPIPDLLSTATALHALGEMKTDLSRLRESCLDFIDSLWTNRGAFHGSWVDDKVDCEYTYYALMALGHLSK